MAEEPEVVLAEVAIHLRLEFDDAQFERLGHLTDEIAKQIAERNFSFEVRVRVDLSEGSVFGKITVSGLLFTLAIFGDIDGSIELAKKVYEGAKIFSETVTEQFVASAGANKGQVESVQVRTNAPKQLVRVLEKIQELENKTTSLSAEQMQVELHKLRGQLERALPNVPRQQKLYILNEMKFKNLPPFSHWPTKPPIEAPRAGRMPDSVEEVFEDKRPKTSGARSSTGPRPPRLRYHNEFVVNAVR